MKTNGADDGAAGNTHHREKTQLIEIDKLITNSSSSGGDESGPHEVPRKSTKTGVWHQVSLSLSLHFVWSRSGGGSGESFFFALNECFSGARF
jgi:hypothetical protein